MQKSGNQDSGEQIARKSFLLYASSFANSGIRWVTLAVVANLLGSGPLGIIAYAYAFIGLFQFLYDFALDKAHIRRISDGEDPGECIGAYLVLRSITVVATTALIFFAFGLREKLLPGGGDGTESQAFTLILISIILFQLFKFPTDTFTARGKIARRVTIETVGNLMDLPVLLAIFFLAGQQNVLGLAWAHLINRCIWSVAALVVFVRASRHEGYRIRRPSRRLLRGYVAFATPLLFALGTATLGVRLDMIMVREFVSTAALGNYHVATRLMIGVLAISGALITLVLPSASRLFAKKDIPAMNALLNKSERYLGMITAYVAMGMIVFAEQIVLIFGADFTVIAPTLVRLLGITTFFASINRPLNVVPFAVNRPWVTLKVTFSLMIANLALNLALMPSRFLGIRTAGLGAAGCALSTAIVTIAGFVWMRIIARRLSGAKTYRGLLGQAFAASLVGGACYLLRPALLSGGRWETLLKAGAMGLAALPLYCLILRAMGLFGRRDVRIFTSLWNPKKLKAEFARELLAPPRESASAMEADIVLIDYGVQTQDLPAILAEIKSSPAKNSEVVLFRSRAPHNLRPLPGNVRLSEDFLADEDYPKIDEFCFGLARDWYRFGTARPDLLGYAAFAEYRMGEKILQIVKDKFVLHRIFEGKDIRSALLYSASPELRKSAETFCGERKIEIQTIAREPALSTPHEGIFTRREWLGIQGGTADILENVAFFRPQNPAHGREWCAIYDGSRFRKHFALSGVAIADYREFSASLPRGESLLRRTARIAPALLRARFSLGALRRKFRKTYDEISALPEFQNRFTFRGIGFQREIEGYLADLFARRLPEIARRIKQRETIFRNLGIKAIIVNDNVQLAKRIELEAARRVGARSLHVQHGVCGETNGESAITTDRIALWGPQDRQWYARNGNPINNALVTGSHKFDAVAALLEGPRPAHWRKDRPRSIVFATQHAPKRSAFDTDDEEEALAEAVVRALAAYPERHCVIKLHPNQKRSEKMYRDCAERNGLADCEILRETELGELLSGCELFITESSTAAMEAVLWGVPILIVNLTRRPDIVPYVPGGVALGAYGENKIPAALKHLLCNDEERKRQAANRARFVADYMHRIDGNSAGRIFGIVEELALGAKPASDHSFRAEGFVLK